MPSGEMQAAQINHSKARQSAPKKWRIIIHKLENTSWIKPGKVIRVGKLAQADAKLCVDFAAERGILFPWKK